MTSLNKGTKDYFVSKGTISKWWNVDKGHLSFHYNKELQVLDENFIVNPAWNVLDIGTGKGRFAIYFAKKGCKVDAVDISEEMLSIAKENAKKEGVSDKITFILGDAEDLTNLKKEYDVVSCMETLDHLPDIEKSIQEIRGRIKSKGYFVFTYVPESSIYWLFYWNILLRKRVGIARAYSDDYISNLFKRNNIMIRNLFGVGLIFPIGPLILRIPLHALARFEKLIKPYYVRPSFVRRCTHTVGWAIKEDLMKTKEVNLK
jgi:SAM-dependent methyltransferase